MVHLKFALGDVLVCLQIRVGSTDAPMTEQAADGQDIHATFNESRTETREPYRGSKPGRSTGTMQRNCAFHYRRAIEILQPTAIFAQGRAVRRWMQAAFDEIQPADERLPIEEVRLGERPCYLATFSHPAARHPQKWGANANQTYLIDVVAPTVGRLRSLLKRT